ncbi:hypothetical protein D5047_00080 [Verminephrobacter eiseniae]|nr:hypothetical protein [Verminephrobacter eiseniae]
MANPGGIGHWGMGANVMLLMLALLVLLFRRCSAVFTIIISIIIWFIITDSVLDGQMHRLFQQIGIINIDCYRFIRLYTVDLCYTEHLAYDGYRNKLLIIQTDHCSKGCRGTTDQIFDERSIILIDHITVRLHLEHGGYRHLRHNSLPFTVRNNNFSASLSAQIHGDR